MDTSHTATPTADAEERRKNDQVPTHAHSSHQDPQMSQ
jgi:hypothetical protein